MGLASRNLSIRMSLCDFRMVGHSETIRFFQFDVESVSQKVAIGQTNKALVGQKAVAKSPWVTNQEDTVAEKEQIYVTIVPQ